MTRTGREELLDTLRVEATLEHLRKLVDTFAFITKPRF